MITNDTTGTTLNRSSAKGFDAAAFRFRQAVDGLGRTIYYAHLQKLNLSGPLFEAAGAEIRSHFWGQAEGLLLMEMPALAVPAPVQPVVPHCMPRKFTLTLCPPNAAHVLALIEPHQRLS